MLYFSQVLFRVFHNNECKVPMGAFYVPVLIFLVIQTHYLVSLPDVVYGPEDRFKASSFVR